jgi:predicted  nucleic acid-binding Zn-ribbon protein
MPKHLKRAQRVEGHHTSCINCGKLVFDHVLARCPKCGGRVTYFSNADLGLLMRASARPVLVADEGPETGV